MPDPKVQSRLVMYERFTDRARDVIRLAEQEAVRARCHYVSPEHVLRALAREGSGVADHVLNNLNQSLCEIRSEAESLLSTGQQKG